MMGQLNGYTRQKCTMKTVKLVKECRRALYMMAHPSVNFPVDELTALYRKLDRFVLDYEAQISADPEPTNPENEEAPIT